MAGEMGIGLLTLLIFFSIYMTLLTGAMRSVIRPERSGAFHLGFGLEELRQIGLSLFFLILFYVGAILLVILFAIVGALVLVATGGGTFMVVIGGIALVLLLVPFFWLGLRLGMAFPLTLLRGRITISESWRLTKGHGWTLFGGFFLIWLILALLSAAVVPFTTGGYLTQIARGGFTPENLQAAAQAQLARQLGPIDTMMVLGWVLSGLAGGVGVALQGGALATATLELVDVRAEMAETFA
jgi:hypothetical protein